MAVYLLRTLEKVNDESKGQSSSVFLVCSVGYREMDISVYMLYIGYLIYDISHIYPYCLCFLCFSLFFSK